MDRQKLAFLALAVSMVYGVLFAVIGEESRGTYAVIGGVIVALLWMSVGVFGKDKNSPTGT